MHEIAYAKLNLALHVRRRRDDGYHELETLFAFVDAGDEVTADVRHDGALTLSVSGPFAAEIGNGPDNLVLRAAAALQGASGCGLGADIRLEKNLPVAAGIGGGSADAAATLRLLTRLWEVRPMAFDFPAMAAALGADVPACVASRTLYGEGVGDRLSPVETDLSGSPVLLVNPLQPCPTGPVFAGWDGVDRGPLDAAAWTSARNDLTPSAIALVPDIADVLAVLRAQVPLVARMSGSGATCFALFASDAERDAAAERIAADHGDWWVMTGALR